MDDHVATAQAQIGEVGTFIMNAIRSHKHDPVLQAQPEADLAIANAVLAAAEAIRSAAPGR